MIDRDYKIESLKNRYKENTGNGPVITAIIGVVGLLFLPTMLSFIFIITIFGGIYMFFKKLNGRQAVEGEIRADSTMTAEETAYIKS